ncbi:MAG: hypothetical protein ISR91_05920 [Candidatus Delongbacteria bacterium]|nr:hypothetical protein [Candidatus Delongbacteria bacterium]
MKLVRHISWFSVLLFTGLLLWGQTGLIAAPAAVGVDAPAKIDMSAIRVTLDAQDASLPDVLAILAEKSGLNIVTGPEVEQQDKITLHLHDVPADQAINLVVRSVGLAYDIVGNSILVGDPKVLKQEVGVNSYVITLQYADAEEVAKMLADFTESITVDVSGNRLIVRTSPKVIAEIEAAVKQVDRPAPQITLEARIIEVNINDEQLLGIDWSKLNSLTTIIAENDVGPGGEPVVVGEASTNTGQLPDQMPFQPIDIKDMGHFSRQLSTFDITLNYMLRNHMAHMLANSSVTTMNNREAEIKVIDLISYVFQAGGNTQQITVKQEEVGVILRITPKINSDGFITTTIIPEVSNIVDWKGPNKDIPQIKKRTATTTIRVRDGESIIIAGLLDRKKTKVLNKVPILGDLPLIGLLFRSTEDQISQSDLVIEVTPHILRPEGDFHPIKPTVIQRIEDEMLLQDILQGEGS